MQKLFSSQEEKLLTQVDKSEKDLRQFICDNWQALFPQYTFITQEFVLKGAVHPMGSSGRIDIQAYNPATKRFVFFELKKNYDKNVGHQAANYRHYIRKNFSDVYVDALQKYKAELPDKTVVDDKEVELILIAKEFTPLLIDQAETESLVTLIKYNWFENGLFLLEEVHEGSGIKQELAKPPGKKPTGGTGKTKNFDCEGEWDYVVGAIRKNVGKQLESIPFTKENVDKLEEMVKNTKLHKDTKLRKDKYAALLKRLEELRLS